MDLTDIKAEQRLGALLIPGDIRFLGPVRQMQRKCYEQAVERLGSRQAVIDSVGPMISMLRKVMSKAQMSLTDATQLAVNHSTRDQTDAVRISVTVIVLLTAAYLVESTETPQSSPKVTAGPGG